MSNSIDTESQVEHRENIDTEYVRYANETFKELLDAECFVNDNAEFLSLSSLELGELTVTFRSHKFTFCLKSGFYYLPECRFDAKQLGFVVKNINKFIFDEDENIYIIDWGYLKDILYSITHGHDAPAINYIVEDAKPLRGRLSDSESL